MKKSITFFLLLALAGTRGIAAADQSRPATQDAAEAENLTAAQILANCVKLIPTERLLVTGSLTVRKARGIELAEHPFKLLLDWGANPPSAEVLLLDTKGTSLVERAVLTRPDGMPPQIRLYRGPEQTPEDAPTYAGRIRGTDMTWLDLSLDFLWWKDVRFADTPRGESHNRCDCDILVATPPAPIPGCSAVRIWIDRKSRCVVQAEQLGPQGNTVRKMWVQRVKEINGRWMISYMEIETLNSGHRTRLLVDDVTTP